jgi:phosphate transport system substrate-binding protein
MKSFRLGTLTLISCVLLGCSVEDAEEGVSTSDSAIKQIRIDGSSTVEPITARIAESFGEKFTDVRVPLKVTGTGTGMKEMIAGRIDIANASRPIKPSELDACEENGVDVVELKIAIDGLSVVVNPENDWVDAMTVGQLKQLWEPDSKVEKWSDLNPDWPDESISLYGPGEESGTFDYFTETINGEEDAITDNYSPSADDNVLVTGVSGDKYALGYFGYAYYLKNKDKLKALSISPTESLDDAVAPTPENIESGAYAPLSRPLFIYVRKSSLQRAEVEDFVRYYLTEGQDSVADAGYVALSQAQLAESVSRLDAAVSGE